MLLATLVPKLIGFRACIPRTLSATLSSSSSSGSTTSLNEMSLRSLTLDEALQLTDPSCNLHAAHCLLYCKTVDDGVEGMFGLCQVRFDGQLGFPGGVLTREELSSVSAVVAGLQRELEEEINFSVKSSESNPDGTNGFQHISTYIDDSRIPCKSPIRVNTFHFFIKQISEQEFKQCEARHVQSTHFPVESLGIFRVPLIDPDNCKEKTIFRYYKKRGSFLVNFFKHNFAGIGKNQLYDSLVHLDCLKPLFGTIGAIYPKMYLRTSLLIFLSIHINQSKLKSTISVERCHYQYHSIVLNIIQVSTLIFLLYYFQPLFINLFSLIQSYTSSKLLKFGRLIQHLAIY